MTKMTKKTAFTMAQAALSTLETEEAAIAREVIAKEIERLERISKRTTPTKADIEKAAFRQKVRETVEASGKAMRAGEVAQMLGVSGQKASAALNALVTKELLIKIDGEKRTVLFAASDFEADAE